MSNPLVKDKPHCTQNSFILFSKRGAAIMRNAPVITAETELTLTGSYNDGVVKIEIVNNQFSCTTLQQNGFSQGIFQVTANTAGDASKRLESDTVTYNFNVIVFGGDRPHLINHFYQFEVGEWVDEILKLNCYVPLHDCGSDRSKMLTDTLGFESGLEIGAMYDQEFDKYQVAVTLSGLAKRPGVYSFVMYGQSSYDTGTVDRPLTEGVNAEAVIIEIKMPDYSAGQKVILSEMPIAQTNNRLVVSGCKLQDTWLTQYLIGDFTNLTRTKSVKAGAKFDKSEFYFEYTSANNLWTLYGRRYMTGNPVPDYRLIATATGVVFKDNLAALPPKSGWTNGAVLSGDIRHWVKDYGYFSIIGEHPIYGEYWQQETHYNPQWEGWTRPSEYVHNQGLIMYQQDGVYYLDAAEPIIVNPAESKYFAIPYAPCRKNDYAIISNGVAIGTDSQGDLQMIVGNVSFGAWKDYVYKRQIPFVNGADNVQPLNASAGATRLYEYEHKEKIASSLRTFEDNRMDAFGYSEISTKENIYMGADCPLKYVINIKDVMDFAIGSKSGGGSASYGYDHTEKSWDNRTSGGGKLTDAWNLGTSSHEHKRTINTHLDAVNLLHIDALVSIGSGTNPSTNEDEIYVVGNVDASASVSTIGREKVEEIYNGWSNPYEYQDNEIHSSAGVGSIMKNGWGTFVGACLGLPKYVKNNVRASFILHDSSYKTTYEKQIFDGVEEWVNVGPIADFDKNITATHSSSTLYINDISVTTSGETVTTIDGVTEKHNDPFGEYFNEFVKENNKYEDFNSATPGQDRRYEITYSKTTDIQTLNQGS